MKKSVYEFISQQTNDPIVEWRRCAVSGEEFPIYAGDITAWEKISPVLGGTKYLFPLPTTSWHTRMAEKLSVRNNRCLYRRVCDLTGESIISLYHPKSKHIVYSHIARHSDQRDPLLYGVDIDCSQSILQQFRKLSDNVPKVSTLIGTGCDNCTYATGAIDSKNCYLTDTCSYTENAWYSSFVLYCENVMDCYKCDHLTNGYMSVRCQKSTNLQYCIDVSDSAHCLYSISLRNCTDCFLCHNLVNKKYYFLNQEYTREEYLLKIAAYDLGSRQVREMLWDIFQKQVIPQTVLRTTGNTNTEKSIGDGLNNCKDIFLGYELLETQDARYVTDGPPKNNTIVDACYVVNADRLYNSFSAIGTGIYCSLFVWDSSYVFYSKMCQNCHDIFGCVGLKNKQYCIFNTQYTKETYTIRVQEIIEAMIHQGERGVFPYAHDFAYNETVAYEYFPLEKQEVLRRGYRWIDESATIQIPSQSDIIAHKDIADHIDAIRDDSIQKIMICPETNKPYRIIGSELAFYKKHTIPIPRIHQDVRYKLNKQYIPARNFYVRACDKTGEKELSVFSDNVPFKVYSQKAYDTLMYG